MHKIILLVSLLSVTLFGDHYFNGNKKISLTKLHSYAPLSKSRNFKSPISYYKNSSGMKLGVDSKIIIDFKDMSLQLYLEKEYSLKFIKSLSPTMYLYSTTKALEVANELNNIKGINFAHPDFIIEKKTRSNDPYYDASWHLNRIDIEKAWNYSKGSGIIVGVYDEGIDIEHEDLRDNIIGFGNFFNGLGKITMVNNKNLLNNNDKNAPESASDKWHGTACAGIIAATGDNNRGSIGVAPKSKLIVARYSNNNISEDIDAMNEMAYYGASIISNSWGTSNMVPAFNNALKNLSENGRNGKGILIFFAAGNDGCNMDRSYEIVSENGEPRMVCRDSSNYDPINDESESPYVISIAATTYNGRIADYSNYGSSIDFAAPGGAYGDSIITTDAGGANGFSYSNYTQASGGFSGTSASAPIAAGIASLILSSNPSLNKEEVIEILKSTATINGRKKNDPDYRDNHWGYGLVNAGDALELAQNYGKIEVENFAQKIYKNLH